MDFVKFDIQVAGRTCPGAFRDDAVQIWVGIGKPPDGEVQHPSCQPKQMAYGIGKMDKAGPS